MRHEGRTDATPRRASSPFECSQIRDDRPQPPGLANAQQTDLLRFARCETASSRLYRAFPCLALHLRVTTPLLLSAAGRANSLSGQSQWSKACVKGVRSSPRTSARASEAPCWRCMPLSATRSRGAYVADIVQRAEDVLKRHTASTRRDEVPTRVIGADEEMGTQCPVAPIQVTHCFFDVHVVDLGVAGVDELERVEQHPVEVAGVNVEPEAVAVANGVERTPGAPEVVGVAVAHTRGGTIGDKLAEDEPMLLAPRPTCPAVRLRAPRRQAVPPGARRGTPQTDRWGLGGGDHHAPHGRSPP